MRCGRKGCEYAMHIVASHAESRLSPHLWNVALCSARAPALQASQEGQACQLSPWKSARA